MRILHTKVLAGSSVVVTSDEKKVMPDLIARIT